MNPLIEMAEIFHLMGDINRLQILLACLDKPVPVMDFANQLGLSPSLVSHHLRLLKASRLLRAERQGKQIFYCVNDEHVRCILQDMVVHLSDTCHKDTEEI